MAPPAHLSTYFEVHYVQFIAIIIIIIIIIIIYIFIRPHRLHAVHRCGLLLQMSNVACSVCLSVFVLGTSTGELCKQK